MEPNRKIFVGIISILFETPREEWSTSRQVSMAILRCPRLRGMIRTLLIGRGVHLSLTDDVLSDVALVLQMKMFNQLDSPENVYSVAYRVSALVISNYGKKAINTSHSKEIVLSDLMIDDESDHSEILDRLSADTAIDNDESDTVKRLDGDLAKKKLTEKLAKLGWPEDVSRERIRLGRPKTPLQSV